MAKTIRKQLAEAFRLGFLDLLSGEPYGLTPEAIGQEPNFQPQPNTPHISFRITVLGEKRSPTADTTDPTLLVWDTRNVIRVKCAGAQAWTWLQVYLDHAYTPDVIAFHEARGFSLITFEEGIQETSRMVGSREQYRGEAVVELNCFTVYDQVIIEAEELIAEPILDGDPLATISTESS